MLFVVEKADADGMVEAEDKPSAWTQHSRTLAQAARHVGNVLKRVDAEDHIPAVVGEGAEIFGRSLGKGDSDAFVRGEPPGVCKLGVAEIDANNDSALPGKGDGALAAATANFEDVQSAYVAKQMQLILSRRPGAVVHVGEWNRLSVLVVGGNLIPRCAQIEWHCSVSTQRAQA